MRRAYTKPCLIVESFQLSGELAAGCNATNNKSPLNHDADSCMDSIYMYFSEICEKNGGIDVDTDDDSLCYHGPTGNNVNEFFLTS